MKKILGCIGVLLILNSCGTAPGNYPVTNASNSTEREYSLLIKTYKSETAEVLNYLLNDVSPDNPKTALSVENTSRCNMVLTVISNNYFKKIPIGAGKSGSVMISKNQTYRLSGNVCGSNYQATKFITTAYSIKLSD